MFAIVVGSVSLVLTMGYLILTCVVVKKFRSIQKRLSDLELFRDTKQRTPKDPNMEREESFADECGKQASSVFYENTVAPREPNYKNVLEADIISREYGNKRTNSVRNENTIPTEGLYKNVNTLSYDKTNGGRARMPTYTSLVIQEHPKTNDYKELKTVTGMRHCESASSAQSKDGSETDYINVALKKYSDGAPCVQIESDTTTFYRAPPS